MTLVPDDGTILYFGLGRSRGLFMFVQRFYKKNLLFSLAGFFAVRPAWALTYWWKSNTGVDSANR
jgi:hypothetical protein